MADEPEQIFLGDTLISATERGSGSGRSFFRRKKKAGPPALTHCENCGTVLTGRFCGQCGQPAVDYRRSFRHVVVDVLDSFLNWDSKFLASVFFLLTRPWKLTNEFLAGHRVRYLNPLRLYLLVSVIFFFVANYGERRAVQNSEPIQFDANDETSVPQEPEPGASPPIDRPGDTDEDESPTPRFVFGLDHDRTPTIFEAWMQQRIEEKIGRHGSKGKFFLRSLMENLPYMMLGCIPVFAFILKTLYFFRRIFYIDHLIYALHIHSFAYLVSLVIAGIGIGLHQVAPALNPFVLFVLIATAVVQVFLSIRRVYGQNWFMTMFKFFLGAFAYMVVIFLALGATTFVTIALP